MVGPEERPFGVRGFLVALFVFGFSSVGVVFVLKLPVFVTAPVGASELNRA